MPRRDLTTPAYVARVREAGFRNALGDGMPLASAHVLDNPLAPGRRFIRLEGCPLRQALAQLLRDLAAAGGR